jgi:minor curlin subunit
MNLRFVYAFVSALVYGTAVQAQQRPPSQAATGAEQRLAEDLGLERLPSSAPVLSTLQNAATLLQNGQGNTARIDQQSLAGGVSNQAYVEQIGAANTLGLVQAGSNSASVVQQGTGNRADLTQNGQGNASGITQKGDNNRLTGLVMGTNNGLNIHQDGSNNQVDSELRQNRQAYTINQYGSGNVLKQVESSVQATPGYTVEMRGTGINLTIEQGKIKP